MEGKIVWLSCDIIGMKKNRYGKQGERVTIKSVRGNVFIVENSKGERFAVNEEFVRQTKP